MKHSTLHKMVIETHGSVSCGPRSRRATPLSILTGRKKCNFRTSVVLCCLDETRRLLLWILPPTSALHNPNLSEIASSVLEICNFTNWLSFFIFFLLMFLPLSHTYKTCYKMWMPYPIALKFGTQKGGIKTHLGTNFGRNTINRQRVMSDYLRKITPIPVADLGGFQGFHGNPLWKMII